MGSGDRGLCTAVLLLLCVMMCSKRRLVRVLLFRCLPPEARHAFCATSNLAAVRVSPHLHASEWPCRATAASRLFCYTARADGYGGVFLFLCSGAAALGIRNGSTCAGAFPGGSNSRHERDRHAHGRKAGLRHRYRAGDLHRRGMLLCYYANFELAPEVFLAACYISC